MGRDTITFLGYAVPGTPNSQFFRNIDLTERAELKTILGDVVDPGPVVVLK